MKNADINNPRPWNGKGLAGEWLVSLKVDGVRAIWHDEQGWLSRANNRLYNIPTWQHGLPRDCEIFVGSFRDPIRANRTKRLKADVPSVLPEHMYGLDQLDPRLNWGQLVDPTPDNILTLLQRAND